MNDQSQKLPQQTSLDLFNVTFSAALPAGRAPYNSQDGQPIDRSGQDPLPANPSVAPEKDLDSRMSVTSGQTSCVSLRSAALNELLASKLKARLDTVGLMEYRQTWKQKVTPLGRSYWAHTASARPISDKDCSGWRTPDHNERGGAYSDPHKALARVKSGHQINLEDQATMAGWRTPTTGDAVRGTEVNPQARCPKAGTGSLNNEVALTGWPTASSPPVLSGWLTPSANEDAAGNPGSKMQAMLVSQVKLTTVSALAPMKGWPTPTATDAIKGGQVSPRPGMMGLSETVGLAGWPTPTKGNAEGSQMAKDASSTGKRPDGTKATVSLNQVAHGAITSSSHASTANRGALNARFSAWLMDFPVEWCQAAIRAHRKLKTRVKRG